MSDTNYDLTITSRKKGQKVEVLADRHLLSSKVTLTGNQCLVLRSYFPKNNFSVLYGYNSTRFLNCQ